MLENIITINLITIFKILAFLGAVALYGILAIHMIPITIQAIFQAFDTLF
jgi:hypothetical protein